MIPVKRFFIFILLPVFSFAQQNSADSLYRILAKTTNDTLRLALENQLGEELYGSYPDSALVLWKDVDARVNEKLKNKKKPEANGYLRQQGNALNNIAFWYTDRGINVPSLEYNFKSLALRESINDLHGIAESRNNIAFFYLAQHDTANALNYFEKSAAGYEAIHDSGGIAFTKMNRGSILLARRKYEQALDNYLGASAILDGKRGQERGYASSLVGIANVFTAMGRFQDAMPLYRKALIVREKNGDQNGVAGTWISIGRLFMKRGMNDSALFMVKKDSQ